MSGLEAGKGQQARKSRRLLALGSKVPPVPQERHVSPEYKANWLSKLTFTWMSGIIATGYKRTLQMSDLPLINPKRSVQDHNAVFSTNFAEAVAAEDVNSPLFKSLHKTFAREFWLAGFYRLAADLLTIGSRYSIRYLIEYISEAYYSHQPNSPIAEPSLALGVGLTVGIILMQLLMSWAQNHFLYSGQVVGGQVRAVMIAKIQEKSMKISERAKAGITVTNLGAGNSQAALQNVDLSDPDGALKRLNGEEYEQQSLGSPAPPYVTDPEGHTAGSQFPQDTRYSRYSRYPRASQYGQPIPEPQARQSRLARISRYSYFFNGNQSPESEYAGSELQVPKPAYARNPEYPRNSLYPRQSLYPRNSLYPRQSTYNRQSAYPRQSRYTWYARYSQYMGDQQGDFQGNNQLPVPQPRPRQSRYTRYTRFSQFPEAQLPEYDISSESQYSDDDPEFPEPEIEYENEDGELVEVHGQGWSNARVLTLVNVDANRIDQCISMVHLVWTSPIIIVVCMALILSNISYSGLSGLACIIVACGSLVVAVKALKVRRGGLNMVIDARVSLTQEVIGAIRMVKFFNWENSFLDRLTRLGNEQTSELQHWYMIYNFTMALGQALPVMAAMCSFITYATGSGHQLDIAAVFSSTALFTSLLIPTTYLPACLSQVSEASAALKRIQEYLLAEEKEDADIDENMREAIKIENAEFSWDRSHTAPPEDDDKAKGKSQGKKDDDLKSDRSSDITLADDEDEDPHAPFRIPSLSLNVRRGELIAVIGGIGSGKSSLISALLGDMRKVSGTLRMSSEVAFCPQAAWIQSATVRDNILFGSPYDPEWYDAVVSACQLRRDFEILSNGDATEIGEKGSSMSGGQKQRVSLARAVYSKADIVLLDDVLSAVDPHVGRAIFENAILGLLRHRTVILATHTTHVLSRCDRILWMDDGMTKALGSFAKLKSQFPEFAEMAKDGEGELKKENADAKESDASKEARKIMEESFVESNQLTNLNDDEEKPEETPPPPPPTIQGNPSLWTVYSSYLSCTKSYIPLVLALPLICMSQAGNLLCGMWLAWWAEDQFNLPRNTYIGIYVGLVLAMGLLLYGFGMCVTYVCLTANKVMLRKANMRVLNAPTWFFDITPLGQITSRFSKDIQVIDEGLPEAFRLFMYSVTMILAICGLIIAKFPWFALAVGPCIVIFFIAAIYYRGAAAELKRFEVVLRSGVNARFSETLTGISTIRTYNMQSLFSKTLLATIDNMNSANYLTFSSQRWLAIRLDFLGVLLIVVAAALVMVDKYSQSPAIAAVVLTYSLSAVQSLQFIVRQWANVEAAMTSTERMYGYSCDPNFPAEGSSGKAIEPAPASWPEQGAINFSNVRMRYRPGLPEVLQGLNLVVKPGEHIGIVGRTGAGKSSLISALFRVCELSRGCVSIDGVDISKLTLSDLRPRISIQPQESILFAGTIRDNLDPLGHHTDQELWLALRGAWLADSLHLDDAVDEEGQNFSHGQRQQLGLARLLVKNSKIVICDEATSSVDLETDEKIQRTMVQAFKGKTVLTVAHRIRTIINYDRICVMDRGRIAELGTPLELFQRGGVFREMCDTSGISEKEILSHHFQ